MFHADEPPATDLLPNRPFSDTFGSVQSHRVSDNSSFDVDVYKVMSLPVIIQRYITAPIRAQSVYSSFPSYFMFRFWIISDFFIQILYLYYTFFNR